MPAWTTPRTWTTGELVTKSIMDTHVRDNLEYVHVTYTTSLPGSPYDGQLICLTDSLTAPTYSWSLRYVSAKLANKWIFTGGAPAFSEVLTSEAGPGAAYGNCATVGPFFAVPVAGEYDVEIGCAFDYAGGTFGQNYMSYDIGGTSAVDADAVSVYTGTAYDGHHSRVKKKTLTAVTLTAKYKNDPNSLNFADRWMRVTPRAIGG